MIDLFLDPDVLFLDEPTSGLDSTTAFEVIQALKRLAQKGHTVITTIHQPSAEIFDLFDQVIFLTQGHIAFMGPIPTFPNYLKDCGFECPPFTNTAEFMCKNFL